jgi:hypothetical protein
MTEFDILDESKSDFSYSIELTNEGKAFLNDFRPTLVDKVGEKRYEKMKDLFSTLNRHDFRRLELLATLLFFCEIEGGDLDAVKKTVRIIKPKFSGDEIERMAINMKELIQEHYVGY